MRLLSIKDFRKAPTRAIREGLPLGLTRLGDILGVIISPEDYEGLVGAEEPIDDPKELDK